MSAEQTLEAKPLPVTHFWFNPWRFSFNRFLLELIPVINKNKNYHSLAFKVYIIHEGRYLDEQLDNFHLLSFPPFFLIHTRRTFSFPKAACPTRTVSEGIFQYPCGCKIMTHLEF